MLAWERDTTYEKAERKRYKIQYQTGWDQQMGLWPAQPAHYWTCLASLCTLTLSTPHRRPPASASKRILLKHWGTFSYIHARDQREPYHAKGFNTSNIILSLSLIFTLIVHYTTLALYYTYAAHYTFILQYFKLMVASRKNLKVMSPKLKICNVNSRWLKNYNV